MKANETSEKLDQNENIELESTDVHEEDFIKISKIEYEKLLNIKEENDKKLLYATADFDNCKKRLSKETEDRIRYANERIILEIMPVIDNLILAMDHAKSHSDKKGGSIEKFFEGVEMIIDGFYNTLSKYGVEKIKSVGEKFDPNFHEAMDQRVSENSESGNIIEEYQVGYKLNGKVIRCSKVCVCKTEEQKK